MTNNNMRAGTETKLHPPGEEQVSRVAAKT